VLAAGFVGFLVLLYLGYTIVAFGRRIAAELPKSRELSGPVALGPEWLELSPEPPLEITTGRAEYVGLELEGVERWDDQDGRRLKRKDSSVVSVQVAVVDEHGRTHALEPNAIGAVVQFGLPRSAKGAEPPAGRRYSKVRIRSEPPLACRRVVWAVSRPGNSSD
jgi:hypothetical protein